MPTEQDNWTQLGPYRVGPRLDQSGNSTRQQLARGPDDELLVAKIFDGPKAGNRYVTEATYQFQHPVLHTATDIEQIDDKRFVVRPYVDGVDLRAIVAAPPGVMKTRVCCRVLLQLCRACEHLSQVEDENQGIYGVAHRTLEARSVLVTRHGDARLINFDYAKAYQDRISSMERMCLPGYPPSDSPPPPKKSFESDRLALHWLTLELFLGARPDTLAQPPDFAARTVMPEALAEYFTERDARWADWQLEARDIEAAAERGEIDMTEKWKRLSKLDKSLPNHVSVRGPRREMTVAEQEMTTANLRQRLAKIVDRHEQEDQQEDISSYITSLEAYQER